MIICIVTCLVAARWCVGMMLVDDMVSVSLHSIDDCATRALPRVAIISISLIVGAISGACCVSYYVCVCDVTFSAMYALVFDVVVVRCSGVCDVARLYVCHCCDLVCVVL